MEGREERKEIRKKRHRTKTKKRTRREEETEAEEQRIRRGRQWKKEKIERNLRMHVRRDETEEGENLSEKKQGGSRTNTDTGTKSGVTRNKDAEQILKRA